MVKAWCDELSGRGLTGWGRETPLLRWRWVQTCRRVWGKESNLREAIRRVGELGRVTAVSRFHDTEPVGGEQPRFLNGALCWRPTGAVELMRPLLEVERAMGRVREAGVLKGPRIIDLDLLLFGDGVMSTPS